MISIVIPSFNEEDHIGQTIKAIYTNGKRRDITEVIVADGGSNDNTIAIATSAGAIAIACPRKGRSAQMNYGAMRAKGLILYFLHADCIPPAGFTEQILTSYTDGFGSGCFRLAFDHQHWFLRSNSWFTRFDINYFRFGDQSLFVRKDVFDIIGGYDETLIVLEDQEIVTRIRKHVRFKVMNSTIFTSARKYLLNGIYKTQAVYFLIYVMFKLGVRQQKLLSTYKSTIKQDKL